MDKLHFRCDQREAAMARLNELTRYAPLLPSPTKILTSFESAIVAAMEDGMLNSKSDEPCHIFISEGNSQELKIPTRLPSFALLTEHGVWVQCAILGEGPHYSGKVRILRGTGDSQPEWVDRSRLAHIPRADSGVSLRDVTQEEATAEIMYRDAEGAWHAGKFHEDCSFYACRVCVRDCRTGEERFVLADCVRELHVQLLFSGHKTESSE